MAFFHLNRPDDIGSLGESIAVNLLQQKGYSIVERNLKVNAKEIDIVAANKDFIVFCEVKTRTSLFGGYPEECVTQEKKRNICFAANCYIKGRHETREPRFDVIGILLHPETHEILKLNHIEGAFFPPQRIVHSYSYPGRWRWHNKAVWKKRR